MCRPSRRRGRRKPDHPSQPLEFGAGTRYCVSAMRWTRWLLLLPVLIAACAPSAASAYTLPKARLSFHVQPYLAKRPKTCVPHEAGGAAPTDLSCPFFEGNGEIKTPYTVYLVVTYADTSSGVAGVQFGIDYDPRDGEGIDILGWTRCSDNEFASPGPNGAWPSAGSGLIAIWNIAGNCQRGVVPGHLEEGVHAVVGAFYVFAYEADVLRVTPDYPRPGNDQRYAVVDCRAISTELQETAMPTATFGDPGEKPCNPCIESCAAEPGCELSTYDLDFGQVAIGTNRYLKVDVRNNGPGKLRIYPQTTDSREWFVADARGARAISPGDLIQVPIAFRPLAHGPREAVFYAANACLSVRVHGVGVKPGGSEDRVLVDSPPGDRRQRLRFTLPRAGVLGAVVFDVHGRLVSSLVERRLEAGERELAWDTGELPSGVYLVRLRAGDWSRTAKVTLVR